jgi:Mn2+/Fe2+ NRAMP family transporter
MLADTDVGNVVTGAQAGAQWGYRLQPLMPMLYMVQELTVRLDIYIGRGHGELLAGHGCRPQAWRLQRSARWLPNSPGRSFSSIRKKESSDAASLL